MMKLDSPIVPNISLAPEKCWLGGLYVVFLYIAQHNICNPFLYSLTGFHSFDLKTKTIDVNLSMIEIEYIYKNIL